MKVSDIVKLMGDKERIVIFENHKCWECDRGHDVLAPWDECRAYEPIDDDFEVDDEGYVCENCEWLVDKIHSSNLYVGRVDSTPIKLSDKRICGITSKTMQVRVSKTSKKTKDVFVFGIQIQG